MKYESVLSPLQYGSGGCDGVRKIHTSVCSFVLIQNFPVVSPYFYSFRILIISQFRDRTFECAGIEGVLRNQVSEFVVFIQ